MEAIGRMKRSKVGGGDEMEEECLKFGGESIKENSK